MNWLVDWVSGEPVLTHGLLVAAMNVAAAYGFDFSVEQLAAINTFVLAALSFLVRQTVTPISDPKNASGASLTEE